MTYPKKVSAAMRERKRMAFALNVKSLESDGRFAGYASVFDVIDNQKDIMMRGAFSDTLKHHRDVKLLWQHQQDEPIGVFERMFEDDVGLYVEGKLLLEVQRAREAHALMKAGAVSGLSIGYSPTRYRIEPETGVRMIAEVELFEVSLVTFPANSSAGVTVVKSTPSPIGGGPGWGLAGSDAASNAPLLTSPLMGEELVALRDALDAAIASLR